MYKTKMKLIWCAVSLGTVAILFGSVKALTITLCDIGQLPVDISRDVFRDTPPKTARGKCVYDCILNATAMLGENGLINADKFGEFIRTLKKFDDSTKEKMITVTNNCRMHKHFSENKCDTAALFVQCSEEEAQKNGLKRMTMTKAIHSAYYALPLDKVILQEIPDKKGNFLFEWPDVEWWPKDKN